MPLSAETALQNAQSGQHCSLTLPFLLFSSKKAGNSWSPNQHITSHITQIVASEYMWQSALLHSYFVLRLN